MTLGSNDNSTWFTEGAMMFDQKHDLDLGTDNGYNFSSSPTVSFPSSSCESLAGSFSSTSSNYDAPFTPASRTPTPQQLFNFETCFDSDSMGYDLTTPPSSATSAYFPMDSKSTVTPDMLGHGLPSTPSRYSNMLDSTLLHDSMVFNTPTHHHMGAYDFSHASLGSSPFMIPTPPPPGGSNNNAGYELPADWPQLVDSSPITFSSPGMSLSTPTTTPLGSSHCNVRRRVALDGPQQSSAMLQQHLQTPTRIRAPKTRPSSASNKTGASSNRKTYRIAKTSRQNMSTVEASKFKCEHCNKTYSRAEHLKRHSTEKHGVNPQKWTCQFCKNPRPFGRSDNFRDHLRRHFNTSSGSRTPQEEGAAKLLAKLQSEMKTKKRRVPKDEQFDSIKPEPLSPGLSSPLL